MTIFLAFSDTASLSVRNFKDVSVDESGAKYELRTLAKVCDKYLTDNIFRDHYALEGLALCYSKLNSVDLVWSQGKELHGKKQQKFQVAGIVPGVYIFV
jgi:hypothetical protein